MIMNAHILLRRLILFFGLATTVAVLLRLRLRLRCKRLAAVHDDAPPPAVQRPLATPSTGRRHCVAVTGANGHLGSAIVELLLLRGHRVRACVRGSPSDDSYASLSTAAATLRALVCQDESGATVASFALAGDCLLAPGCAAQFGRAFAGVDTVVHTAMPTDRASLAAYGSEAYRTLRGELIAATIDVLEAAKAAGVQTFVHTSSSTAVVGKAVDGRAYNEDDWSDEQPGASSHGLLKAAVERAVVEWHEKHASPPFRLVRICPAAIIGASAAAAANESLQAMVISPLTDALKWSSVPQMRFPLCSLRDAALAHVLAVENQHAHGRFCVGEQMLSAAEWLAALRSAGYCWPTYLTLHLSLPRITEPLVRALRSSSLMQAFLGLMINDAQRSAVLNVLDAYLSAPGPAWLTNSLLRALLSAPPVQALLGLNSGELESALAVLGTSTWAYDCSRAKRELAPCSQRAFRHASVRDAGVEAARSLEARGMLSGRGGRITPEGRLWRPSPWEAEYLSCTPLLRQEAFCIRTDTPLAS